MVNLLQVEANPFSCTSSAVLADAEGKVDYDPALPHRLEFLMLLAGTGGF